MAQLADLASEQEGRMTLTDILERRSNPNTRLSYESLDPHLVPAVSEMLER